MKNATVIDAINELIKGVNIAFARNAYSMQEVRDIYNAIEFLGEVVKAQQTTQAPAPGSEPVPSEGAN